MQNETKNKNEFEDEDMDAVPENEFADVPQNMDDFNNSDDLISSNSAGVSYNWNMAPDSVKAPPRIQLDGEKVTIKKADILLPPESRPWDLSRDKTKKYKMCNFILYFDRDGQQESYSGCRVFEREDNKYSHPTITRDKNNQVSKMLGKYAEFKGKDINECSLKEFMAFLNSKPKARICVEDVRNPSTNEIIKKNMIDVFI
jgi:hypothetical protein